MRNVRLLLGSGLVMGALVLIGMAVAQSPDKKGGPPQDKQGGPPRGPDGFGGRGGPRGIERALDDLKLTDKKKDKAEAIVKAYEENVRKLQDLAKSDLLVKLKDILSEQELKTFTAALDRQPGPGGPGGRDGRGPGGRGPGGRGPGGRGGPAGIERGLDDLALTGPEQDQAEATVKAYRENVTKMRDLAKSDLPLKMKEILSEAQTQTLTR